MKKLGLICMVVVLAMGALGIGYAYWSDTLYINGDVDTGNLEWYFAADSDYQLDAPIDRTSDSTLATFPSLGEDVAYSTTTLVDSDSDGDLDTLQVTVDTVYPGYANQIRADAYNGGTIPLKIQSADISYTGNGGTVYTHSFTNNSDVWSTPDGVFKFKCAFYKNSVIDPQGLDLGAPAGYGPIALQLSYLVIGTGNAVQESNYQFAVNIVGGQNIP